MNARDLPVVLALALVLIAAGCVAATSDQLNTASPLATKAAGVQTGPPITTPAPPANPAKPIAVTVQVGRPLTVGQAVPVTMTTHTSRAVQGVGVGLILFQNTMPIGPNSPPWRLSEMGAEQTTQFTTTVVFPAYDHYLLRVEVSDMNGPIDMAGLVIELPHQGQPVVLTTTPFPTSTARQNPPQVSTAVLGSAASKVTAAPPTKTPGAVSSTPAAIKGQCPAGCSSPLTPCGRRECLFADSVLGPDYPIGMTTLEGYFTMQHRLGEGGEKDCESLVVTGGSETWTRSYLRRVQPGNSFYITSESGEPVISIDLSEVEEQERARVLNSTRSNPVQLLVLSLQIGQRGYPLCQSIVSILQVH